MGELALKPRMGRFRALGGTSGRPGSRLSRYPGRELVFLSRPGSRRDFHFSRDFSRDFSYKIMQFWGHFGGII